MLVYRARSMKLSKVYPLGALTAKLGGERLTEMAVLRDAGCIAFSPLAQGMLTDKYGGRIVFFLLMMVCVLPMILICITAHQIVTTGSFLARKRCTLATTLTACWVNPSSTRICCKPAI